MSGYRLACPGVDEYGHGLTAAQIHMGECCDEFAALDDAAKAERGLRVPTYEDVAEDADDDADGM